MEQVFFAEPMYEGSLPNGMYKVTRLNEITGKYQDTIFQNLTFEAAKEKAHELNVENNECNLIAKKNKKKTLYVIGNGFDLYHGLPTSYRCFLCYMLTHHPEAENKMGLIFDRNNPNKLWSNFEEELGKFDAITLVKENIDKWINMADVQFTNSFLNLHCDLQGYFKDWVQQIRMDMYNGKKLEIDSNALFLTFNYTNTLERFYGVKGSNICYIHQDTMNNPCANPIVGHPRNINYVEKVKCEICQYVRIHGEKPTWAITPEHFAESIIHELNDLWDGLAKEPRNQQINPNEIYTISQYGNDFKAYHNVDDIYVMGHSLGVVDKDYFIKLYKVAPAATWHLSTQSVSEATIKQQKLCELIGVSPELIKCDTFVFDELLTK